MHHEHTDSSYGQPQPVPTIARRLGWFSVALGVAELVAPEAIARACGMPRHAAGIVRMYGVRELITGIGLLTTRNPVPWLLGRVGGDVIDMATIGAEADMRDRHSAARAGGALLNVAAVTALDAYAVAECSRAPARAAARHDYGSRTGFPRPASEMRGAALSDFSTPADMRTPEPLRPWSADGEPPGVGSTGRNTANTDEAIYPPQALGA